MTDREIYLIGDEDSVAGFRLAGVKNAMVIHKANIEEVYGRVKDEEAFILLTQNAFEILGERTEDLRRKSVVQVIPSEDYPGISRLIRHTVGFELRK